MTRYAPTLLIGLGGSGVKVLRWIRHQQAQSSAGGDLLVYRGIDFDLDANAGSRVTRLDDGEFFYFDASSIADCVGNLRAELRGNAGPPRRPFREIAEWYPDVEGKFIRYAQAEAVGARQWRPLGRIGFFLNDVEIMEPLREGVVQVDARSGTAGELRPASICIITSIAGGTGSGILLDVAANLRKYRPEIGIRLILLLPEFFEHVDFTSKVLANSYATLTEIAHFKNQDQRFTARYPRLPDIDERMQNSLFQRVYLVGPYVGDRRPFVEPDDAFAHVAALLRVFLTKELRSNAGSYQINDDADQNSDAAAMAGDFASRQVFCGFAAAAIPLLTYDDLAMRWVASFVDQWHSSPDRRDMFAAVQPPPSPEALRRLQDYVDATAAPSEAGKYLSAENFAKVLGDFISKYASEQKTWTQESLRAFTEKLAAFSGAGATDMPHFLAEPVEQFRAAFRSKLSELLVQHELTPFALLSELRIFAERLRTQCKGAESTGQKELEEFHRWLGGYFDVFLGRPLVEFRIEKLKEWIEEWQREHGRQPGMVWFAYGIRSAAVHELEQAIRKLESEWSGDGDFVAALAQATEGVIPRTERKRERFALDSRRARPAAEILRQELNRVDRNPERMGQLCRAMLGSIRDRLAEGIRTRDYHSAARSLLGDLKDHFVRELQPGGRVASGAKERFRYLSPESTYDDDVIRRAVLSAATRLFRPGRIDNNLRKRTGRLIVPQSFAGSDAFTHRLKHLCNGLLGASMREVSADGAEENRILILVEDLFHSAEELSGIYDYYNDYSRQRRELFHIRYDIPSTFDNLITSVDRPGPKLCGNPGCKSDLRGTPRTEIFCPHCGNPIRNRCGNLCPMDDLTERPDRDAAIQRGLCPVCALPLRTYWWFCSHHGRVPTEVPLCTVCVAEKRAAPERRPYDADPFVCPGCIRRGINTSFRATGIIARALTGQPITDTASVCRALEQTLLRGRSCTECGVELVPFCRRGGSPHLLRRDPSGWVCDLHAGPIYACGSCDFPLGDNDYFCPRCETRLADCRFCTAAHKIRVVFSADPLCTRCRLPHKPPFGGIPVLDEDPSHVFCSNIYGCAVGAEMLRTTYPAGTHTRCAVCGDIELSLLEVRTRSSHLGGCSFCRALFESRDDHVNKGRALSSGLCCLCGQRFATSRSLAAAPQSFEIALSIGSALLQTRDDAVAFGLIFDEIPPTEQHRIPSHIRDYAARVERAAVRRIVHPRLTNLLACYQQQFGCQRSAAARDPVEENGHAPEAAEEEETVESVLSSARVSGLHTNDDFERWVAAVVRLEIDYDRFDAALGGSSSDMAAANDRPLQDLRDHARALYRRMTMP
ncbi:MAG TPA: tubulin-like doman-containing protein [Thermoanaerobaculia bacterium]|nr:tubulin-like doman-containing protein [Thermoanaerobaculia bacterium]